MSSLGELLAAGLVMVLQIVELFVLLVVLDRLGFQPASLEAGTWHGRPVSQADHDPEGPHFGFVLFMLGIFVLLAFNIFAVDALLSLV